ncbi:hypothetical protein FALBO_12237 [Fusarium albosuccineum]|uniref:Uncharacterized protein n=1 Tax=Fusarium albosuccineum TaxID=1237068 RepID=A0A8H4L3R6_9HYPO|nr:hypothetical protein FALBO_12237 [Fusarium albosuccineum]
MLNASIHRVTLRPCAENAHVPAAMQQHNHVLGLAHPYHAPHFASCFGCFCSHWQIVPEHVAEAVPEPSRLGANAATQARRAGAIRHFGILPSWWYPWFRISNPSLWHLRDGRGQQPGFR